MKAGDVLTIIYYVVTKDGTSAGKIFIRFDVFSVELRTEITPPGRK